MNLEKLIKNLEKIIDFRNYENELNLQSRNKKE